MSKFYDVEERRKEKKKRERTMSLIHIVENVNFEPIL